MCVFVCVSVDECMSACVHVSIYVRSPNPKPTQRIAAADRNETAIKCEVGRRSLSRRATSPALLRAVSQGFGDLIVNVTRISDGAVQVP